MRRIAHISDLHFGRLSPDVLGPLRDSILAQRPDLLVVSGDLTQRARAHQFRQARAFLDTLALPRIVVPGNHDVPLDNLLARWLWPLHGYRTHVEPELVPFHCDGEMAVVGLSTARSLTIKGGRLNGRQVEQACARLQQNPQVGLRILVTHHPFDVIAPHQENDIVGRAAMAMEAFARCGVDLILAGHLHNSHIAHGMARYGAHNRVLLVQAGTATSARQRGETNAWNLLTLTRDRVEVTVMAASPGGVFLPEAGRSFLRQDGGWAAPAAAAGRI